MTPRIFALTLGFALAAATFPAYAQQAAPEPARAPAAATADSRLTLAELLRSARKGDVLAQRLLGDRYDRGNGLPRDYNKAIYWYLRAAKQGDRAAQRNLGYIYETGLADEQDYKEAEKWYRQAALQGDTEAQRSLVYIYESGLTGRPDPAEAAKWADRAAGRRVTEPAEEIARVERQLLARIRGVVAGSPASAVTNGDGEDQGLPPAALPRPDPGGDARPLDIGLSLNRYHLAAEDGDAHAQYRLGLVYLEGRGVRHDGRRARQWLARSAAAGYARAQAALGAMYAKGIGAERDLVQAYFWLQQAAQHLPDGETKDYALSFGEAAKKVMTPAQHAQAGQLARDFHPDPEFAPATIR